MSGLIGAAQELVGLFVDDGSLAVGLAIWIMLLYGGTALWPGLMPWTGAALFLGCLAILLENLRRAARRR